MPLPSLSALHAELEELVETYEGFYLQMIAAEEALGGHLTRLSRERGETAAVQVLVALSGLVVALEKLQGVEWKEAPSELMHANYACDIGRVLQDLRSAAGNMDKAVKHLRFLAFHSGITAEPAVQIPQEGKMDADSRAPNAEHLKQVCKKLERRVKGVQVLVTMESRKNWTNTQRHPAWTAIDNNA